MKRNQESMYAVTITRILVGLVMLVPGLVKLLVFTPSGVSQMLSGIGLFAWAPGFWAWVLILSEIIFGIAIIANYKLRLTAIPPMIILLVASFTMALPVTEGAINYAGLGSFLMHLSIVAILWTYSAYDKKK